MNSITFLIIAFLIVSYAVNQAVVKSIKAFLQPDLLLEQVEQIDDLVFLKNYQEFNDWAIKHGYQTHSLFLFRIVTGGFLNCAAWWNEKQKTWALIYCFSNKINIDFVTLYDKHISVTTASSRDALLLPRLPKSYLQVFTKLSFDERYTKHQTACQLIKQQEHLNSPIQQQELLNILKLSLKSQAEYIMSLPLWQWRGVYWYFVRRYLNVNKPIKF